MSNQDQNKLARCALIPKWPELNLQRTRIAFNHSLVLEPKQDQTQACNLYTILTLLADGGCLIRHKSISARLPGSLHCCGLYSSTAGSGKRQSGFHACYSLAGAAQLPLAGGQSAAHRSRAAKPQFQFLPRPVNVSNSQRTTWACSRSGACRHLAPNQLATRSLGSTHTLPRVPTGLRDPAFQTGPSRAIRADLHMPPDNPHTRPSRTGVHGPIVPKHDPRSHWARAPPTTQTLHLFSLLQGPQFAQSPRNTDPRPWTPTRAPRHTEARTQGPRRRPYTTGTTKYTRGARPGPYRAGPDPAPGHTRKCPSSPVTHAQLPGPWAEHKTRTLSRRAPLRPRDPKSPGPRVPPAPGTKCTVPGITNPGTGSRDPGPTHPPHGAPMPRLPRPLTVYP